MTLEEALPKLLEQHVESYSPDSMIYVLQCAIDGIRNMQEFEKESSASVPCNIS